MRRRTLSILLALTILLCLSLGPAAGADSSGVCFIATNDRVLDLSLMPVTVNRTTYVHYSVFSTFGISTTYFKDSTAALLYAPSSGKQLYFEIESGNTYDADGRYYSTQAILRGGQTYVPVQFVCQFFGLASSYISGVGYGDILRITDGGAKLSDADFLSAAEMLMRERLNEYNLEPSVSPSPTASSDPTPFPSPGSVARPGARVCLSFYGLPSDTILSTLSAHSVYAAFFLTAAEIRSAPDVVRRIAGEGHSLGVSCSANKPEEEYTAATSLLFEAARIRTLLVSSSADDADAVRGFARENALVYCGCDIDGTGDGAGVSYSEEITSVLSLTAPLLSVVRLVCTERTDAVLPDLLTFLIQNRFDLRPVCEVGNEE